MFNIAMSLSFIDISFFSINILHMYLSNIKTLSPGTIIGSTWEKHKNKFLIKKITKNN